MNMDCRDWIISSSEPVLVTGSNGFIGSRVVKVLLDYGFSNIRCFVRPSSDLRSLRTIIGKADKKGITIVEGNLLNPADCREAINGISVVYHLAAGMDSSFAGCFINSVLTTRNLLNASLTGPTLKRFVNISSFAVYSNMNMARGSLLDETAPLENDPAKRNDAYGYAKLKQEQLVAKYHRDFNIPYAIVRPGAVFGPGKSQLTGRVGINPFGVFLHLGGSNYIPFTYVDNCAGAIILAGLVKGAEGQAFNVVDDDLPTSKEFLRIYKKELGSFFSISLPYFITNLLCGLWESYSNWSDGQLPLRFNRRQCAAEWKGNRYSNAKLKAMLGWRPQISFSDACQAYFNEVKKKRCSI
jgi:nucleoside-diphosphate-sugar epimerase